MSASCLLRGQSEGYKNAPLEGNDPSLLLLGKSGILVLTSATTSKRSAGSLQGKCCMQVQREGKDITLVGFGKMVGYNLDAAKELEKEGISAEVSLGFVEDATTGVYCKPMNTCV